MPAQKVRWMNQQPIPFAANQRQISVLNRGLVMRELQLRLQATITTTSNTAAADFKPGDEWALLKSLDLIVNTQNNIRSFTGEQLRWLNTFWYNRPPTSSVSTGVQSLTIDSLLTIPLWSPKSIRPIDTALNTALLADLRLECQWGAVGDILSTAGAAFSVNPTLSIQTLEAFGYDGPFNGLTISRLVKTDIGGATSGAQLQLPVGNLYRGFLISQKDASGNDYSASRISQVRLKSGPTVLMDWPYQVLQRQYFQQAAILETATGFAGVSTNANRASWLYVDLATDEMNSELPDTLGLSQFTLEFDTTAAIPNLTVLPIQIQPIRKAN